MLSAAQDRRFFVTGGTLPADSASYVERSADRSLFESLLDGRFCYVLSPRQMGKSSLSVRTIGRLQAVGVRTAFLDMTRFGGKNLTAEQWYTGIALELARELGCRREVHAYWKENSAITPVQRLFAAIRDVALASGEDRLVIFIDEIDATQSLPFDPDEFYAAIRESFNRRVSEPAFERLSFCLLGVAVPSDLIRNPAATPFNIGERISLNDFTLDELGAFSHALGANGPALVRRVHYWTAGHPFLSQSLCRSIAASDLRGSVGLVDMIVKRDLFDFKERLSNINLADVANIVLHYGDSEPDPAKFRADMLSTYLRVLTGREVTDDDSNRVAALLKLSGIVNSDGRRLRRRNRVYQRVFDRKWVEDNMPGQELRRQRRALWRGVLRTTAVSAVVVITIGWLAHVRRIERDAAEYLNYTTTMRLIPEAWKGHNLTKVRRMVEQTAQSSHVGWEWDYWNRMSHQDAFRLRTTRHFWFPAASPDGKAIWYTDQGYLWRLDVPTRALSRLFKLPNAFGLTLLPDGVHLLANFTEFAAKVSVVDLRSGRQVSLQGTMLGWNSPTPDACNVVGVSGGRITEWDIATGRSRALGAESDILYADLSPDGRRLVVLRHRNGEDEVGTVSFPDCRPLGTFGRWSSDNMTISPDSRLLCATVNNELRVWDMESRRLVWESGAGAADFADLPRFSPDGRYLMASTQDRLLSVYEHRNRSFSLVGTFPESGWSGMSRDDSTIAIQYDAGYGSELRFLDWRRYRESLSFAVSGAIDCRSYPDGDRLSILLPNSVVWFDPLTGRKEREVRLRGIAAFNALQGTVRPEEALLVRDPQGAEIIDCESAEPLMTGLPARYFTSNGDDGLAVSRIDQDHFLIACIPEPALDLWDRRTKRLVRSIHLSGTATALSTSPDKRTIAAGLDNGNVMLYDTATWTARTLAAEPWWVTHLHFSRDGRYLLAGTNDDFAIAYDLETGESTRTMTHEQVVLDIDISPDHRRLVTCSADRTVRLWDAETGAELTTLNGHSGSVNYVRFTSDGKSIVSWGADGVRTWTLRN